MNYKKIFILFIVLIIFNLTAIAQEIKTIEVNKEYHDFHIKENQNITLNFSLKKDVYYSITVTQKGIDVELFLKDNQGKVIEHMDSPNGKYGPEKIIYSSDKSSMFSLLIKPLKEDENAEEGDFSISITKISNHLKKLSYDQLIQDFEILKNAYIETKVGLWYNSYSQFDSLCTVQKQKIRANMNALEFYKIMAPITAYTKEGHCNIRISDQTSVYIKQNGKYFPFRVKIFDGKAYVLNNFDKFKTKGLLISKINNNSIDKILKTFLSIEPNDGYNETGKYAWIEAAFSRYYLRFFEVNPKSFDVDLINPDTREKVEYKNIPSYSYKEMKSYFKSLKKILPKEDFDKPVSFSIDSSTKTATLTVNSFDTSNYKNGKEGFHNFLDKTFKTILAHNTKYLIIDIRKNEGGEQGMEDYLLSYLIDKPYAKYKYVEIPSFSYSFIKYTDYKNDPDNLKRELKKDFAQNNDGRYLNIKGSSYEGTVPNKNNFKGKIYILISRLTFSGGSEFATMAKNYTNAIFIGEETSGGFYGNTSGTFLKFTLPNSQLTGRIPLCKFVLDSKNFDIPFGHGLLPDFKIKKNIKDHLNGIDNEMIYTKKLIKNGQ